MDNYEAPRPVFEDTVDTIKNNGPQVTEQVTEQVTDNAKKSIDYYTSKAAVIGGLIFVVFLCLFVSYGLYVVISSSLFNQSKIVIQGTKVPVVCNVSNTFEIQSFNKSGNGKRRSFTFWIYINDLNKYNGSYKHVWHIGDQKDIKNGSPFVFMDAVENKLYVRFAAVDNDTFTSTMTSIQTMTQIQLNQFMQQGIVIPYVPIQRWVHIAVVVNENSNGGTIVAYVDGDISKIVTSGEIRENGTKLKLTNLDLDKVGQLYVGGSTDSLFGVGFSGLISKVSMFNYDLNDRDIYNDYNEGPLSGFLSSLGLANYGLRSPIYKIV